MKKIQATSLAIILLHLSTILSAQVMYSETIKQTSFTQSEAWGETFSPTYVRIFIDLDVKKTSNGAQLSWKFSDWNNVSRFEIQKSTNNRQFTTIGSVDANEKDVYRFTDREPVLAPTYFRIKCIDRNGTATYSSVVSTGLELTSGILIAYPMPAQGEITVQHALVTDKAIISVYTPEGDLVMSVPAGTGTMQTALDFSYLKAGVYLLRFENGSGKAESMRIVKQ